MTPGPTLQLNAVARGERHVIMNRVIEQVSDAGGSITDFHQYSNVMICLNIEIPAGRISQLKRRIKEAGLVLKETVQDTTPAAIVASDLVTGTLEITFLHDEPDLRIPVPPIPG